MTLDEIIAALIEREGGYVNHPADRGGPTKYGITLKVAQSVLAPPVTIEVLKGLTHAQAAAIYKRLYWFAPKFHTLGLSPACVEMVFDAGVHHGPKRAVMLLQRAIGTKMDGVIGPITVKMAQGIDPEILAARFLGERLMFIANIVKSDPSQLVFLVGWMARIREFMLKIPQN